MSTQNWNRKLDKLAKEIIQHADDPLRTKSVLRDRSPELYEQIVSSGRCRPLLKLWGQSRNIDDNTGTEIVSPAVLNLLGTLTGFSMESPVPHAGIQHTYGYLFSLIETPYGRKRDRWVSSSLEDVLGLRRPTFSPVATEGTLLLNLTYFLGRILYRGRPTEIACLRRNRHLVDSALPQFNYRQQRYHRIIEEMGKGNSKIRTLTDLLPLNNSLDPENFQGLLIYGIEELATQKLSLITTFPISKETFQGLLSLPSGRKVVVQLKYNAYAKNILREPTLGKRTIHNL